MDDHKLITERKTWDAVASSYQTDVEEDERRLADEIERILIKKGLKPNDSLIEMGCGSGHLSLCLAQKGYRVTLVDFSPKALEKAKQTFERYGQEAEFLLGDLFLLDDGTAVHDFAWNSGVMEHFGDDELLALMKNIGRFARKGVLYLVPNSSSIAYLLMRARSVADDQWEYGDEYLRRDYDVLLRRLGYQDVSKEYIVTAAISAYQIWKAEKEQGNISGIYRILAQEQMLPPEEGYLSAYYASGYEPDAAAEEKYAGTAVEQTRVFDLAARKIGYDEQKAQIADLENRLQEYEAQKKELESELETARQTADEIEHDFFAAREEHKELKDACARSCQQIMDLADGMEAALNAKGLSKMLKLHAVLGAAKREDLPRKLKLMKNMLLRAAGRKQPLGICAYRMDLRLLADLNKVRNISEGLQAGRQASGENHSYGTAGNDREMARKIRKILSSDYDRVVIWNSSFGWNVTLFQRPQHIAAALAGQRSLVFYEVTEYTDPDVLSFRKQKQNLWLVNRNSRAFSLLRKELQRVRKPKYMQVYSTEQELSVRDLQNYQREGYHILYEYIDDIHPDISVTKKVPANIRKKYEYVMRHPEIPVVVTADRLREDTQAKRGCGNLAFATNGVDYGHFANPPAGVSLKQEYQKILSEGRTVIGYYGALASWFDYQLVKEIAQKRSDVVFVLIGKIYDHTFEKAGLMEHENIVYLGEVPYQQLPAYAARFDICTIPFVISTLTDATSPLKLFEYMALSKPIITTGMRECRKYGSVLIADSCDEYCEKIDLAQTYRKENNKRYFDLLKKEALDNTWNAKAASITEMLGYYEAQAWGRGKNG